MNTFHKIKTYLIIGIVCFLAGKYIFPPDGEVKVKEVVKYVEKKQEDKKTRVVTRIKETSKNDGTTTKETVIVEDSTNKTTSVVDSEKKSENNKTSSSKISFGIMVLKDVPEFSQKTHIGVLTSIPLFGKLSIIGTLDTTKRVGLGVSVGF